MPRIFDMIRGVNDPGIDRALAAALPTATPDTARPIVDALLERQRMPGSLALIEQYHRLPIALRARIVEHAGDLATPLRHAASKSRTAAAANAVEIIFKARLWSLAYLVSDVLRRGDAERRQAAGPALLRLARLLAAPATSDRPIGPRDARHIRAAVADAVIHFGQHRRREALSALVLLLPHDMATVRDALREPKHPAISPLSAMLAKAQRPTTRRALLPLLSWPTLADACLSGLAVAVKQGTAGDALCHAGCLAWPGTRRVLLETGRPKRLWPSVAGARQMPPDAQRALPGFAELLSRRNLVLIQRLADLAGLPDEAARLAALRRLIGLACTGALADQQRQAIERFTHDAAPAVARPALRHLMRGAHEDLPRILARLCNSPHVSVARLAEEALAPVGFARLWSGWPTLCASDRLALGKALIKLDSRFHQSLSRKLSTGRASDVLRSLSMIHALGQASFFEAELVGLSDSEDVNIVATSIRVLGAVDTAESRVVIDAAIEHPDTRVRANAIEALAQRGDEALSQEAPRLQAIAQGPENRPRANAIHSLLRLAGTPAEEEASAELGRMLHDDRPEHRRSALWVVESAALIDRAAEVAEMAVSDTDQQVQARARRAFERMVSLLAPRGMTAVAGEAGEAALARISQATQLIAEPGAA